MKFIDQSHEILHITPNILETIEISARNCYKSEDKIKEGSAAKIVKMLIKRKHEAMLEFGDIHLRLITSRSVLAELSRHRLCSLAVESQRYVAYKDEIEIIRPVWWKFDKEMIPHSNEWVFSGFMQDAELCYQKLLKRGWRPQEAREVLPNAMKTEIVLKANVREMRHILKVRTSSQAHPMIKSLFNGVLDDLVQRIPVLFEDIKEENDNVS